MGEIEFGEKPKRSSKSSFWKVTATTIWFAVAGVVGVIVYIWIASDSKQVEQVQKLRKEMDSLSKRGYQLQHKIDSLDRLGVADFQLEDSVLGDR